MKSYMGMYDTRGEGTYLMDAHYDVTYCYAVATRHCRRRNYF